MLSTKIRVKFTKINEYDNIKNPEKSDRDSNNVFYIRR